jgi:hypothetical protein
MTPPTTKEHALPLPTTTTKSVAWKMAYSCGIFSSISLFFEGVKDFLFHAGSTLEDSSARRLFRDPSVRRCSITDI